MRLVLGLILWFCLAGVAAAEPWDGFDSPLFSHLTVDHGLPYPIVLSVAQDKEGFVWFGTPGGLARWDGYRMQVFRQDNTGPAALPENIVPSLMVDEHGTLWVGTISGLVARYDGSGFTTYRHQGSGLGRLRGMASDGSGGVWAVTQTGLAHLDRATGLWSREDNAPGDISCVLRDRSGTLWIGTPVGLMRRVTSGEGFELVPVAGGAERLVATAMREDGEGRLWFGTATGRLGMVDPVTGMAHLADAVTPSGQRVSDIVEPRPGVIWIGEVGGGIRELRTQTDTVRRFSHNAAFRDGLADDSVMAMMIDRSGLVWVVGLGGVNQHNPRHDGIATVLPDVANGLLGKDVRSMTPGSDGTVWLGFGAEGVALLDPAGGAVRGIRSEPGGVAGALPRLRVQAVAAPDNGDVWVGTTRGLYRVDHATGRASLFAPLGDANILVLQVEGSWLWVGGTLGLARIDLRDDSVSLYQSAPGITSSLSDNSVQSLLRGRDGRLWVGTQRGLNVMLPGSDSMRRILHDPDNADSLPSDVANALVQDRFGRLWVGTANGIGILDGEQDGQPRFLHLTTTEGLPHNTVTVLLADDRGIIWAGTGDRLAAIDPQSLAIRTFGPADGAGIRTTWAGSGARMPDGTLLFGGLGGMTVIHPERLLDWRFRPPVVITGVRIGDTPLPLPLPEEGLTITPMDRGLEVDFSALDFSSPQRNRYAYRLEGFDDDWVDTDAARRTASYTNLAPGAYRLHIRGSNRLGVWSEPPLELPIRVLPAWYQTVWFRLLEAVAAIAVVVAAIQGRTALLRRRQRDLEAQVRRRTEELEAARATAIAREEEARCAKEDAEAANRAKSRFLAVASHEIRTPLNGVLGMLQMLDAEALPLEQRQYLDIAKMSGHSLMGLIDSILDYGRHEAETEILDVVDFDPRNLATEVVDLFRPRAEISGVLLDLEVMPSVPAVLRCDRVRLARILHNLLGNAIKFTPRGMVEVAIDVAPAADPSMRLMRIAVADTGIGIAPERCEAIFQDFVQADDSIARRFGGTGLGLAICRRAATRMGGTLTVESSPEVGSTFQLVVPVELGEPAPVPAPAAATAPGLTLLLVDDDEVNRLVGAGLLGRLGHAVTVVQDGASAVEAAATTDFDVILMDLHMPGLDGIEASRRIRSLPNAHRAGVRLIAVTADLTQETRNRCLQAGIEEMIGKPLRLDALSLALSAAPTGAVVPTAEPAGDPGWINLAFLTNQWELLGSSELVKLVRLFHRASRLMIAGLDSASAAGDRAAIQAIAHRLNSSAGALGLVRLSAQAAAIEAGAWQDAADVLAMRIAALGALRRGSMAALFAAARCRSAGQEVRVAIPNL